MSSLTTAVFGHPSSESGRWWIYYTVRTTDDLSKALRQTNPMVLMFSADWNEPSRVMKKPFRDMALARKNQAVFCVVDVDRLRDHVAQQFQVEALPTFVLLKDGKQLRERVVGVKVDDLNTAIDSKLI